MKKCIIILICSIINISCNGQNNSNKKIEKEMHHLKEAPYNITDDGDGTVSSFDQLSSEIMLSGKKLLEQRKFIFPNDFLFKEKINEIFDFDIDQYKNLIIALRPNSMFPEIVLKDYNYVLIQDADSIDENLINQELLYWYNSYIFYQDQLSYKFLKLKYPYILKDLVIEYGYNKDKDLVSFVFNDFDFESKNLFHDLIFTFDINKNKYVLRESIFDDIENIIYKGPVNDFSTVKEGKGYSNVEEIINEINSNYKNYFEPERTIAYILNRDLRIGVQGHTESYLKQNTTYKSYLVSNNYFGYDKLKNYVEYIFEDNSHLSTQYFIQDKDGYTNLREEQNSNSKILQQIKSGENINVLDNIGDWYLVETKEGNKGYVHKSRIKSK